MFAAVNAVRIAGLYGVTQISWVPRPRLSVSIWTQATMASASAFSLLHFSISGSGPLKTNGRRQSTRRGHPDRRSPLPPKSPRKLPDLLARTIVDLQTAGTPANINARPAQRDLGTIDRWCPSPTVHSGSGSASSIGLIARTSLRASSEKS